MFVTRSILCTVVLSLLVGNSSQAAVITTPSGLNPGDQYRLAFVTSGTTNATSTNVATYNNFVSSAATAVPELNALGTNWNVIGSTGSIEALQNAATPKPGGLPIYLLNDTKLADDYDDLWDASIDVQFNITESGSVLSNALVLTGTEIDGGAEAAFPLGGNVLPLQTRTGNTSLTTNGWVFSTLTPVATQGSLYAISSVLTVVPEPSSFLLGLVGAGVLGVGPVFRRSRFTRDQ